MCCATETWPDNKAVAKAMQTTHRALERCFMKTSLRQEWQQGIRSSELREKSQLADPLQYMKKSKYRWAGHLLRRKDDRKRSLPHWMQVARDRAVWKSCGPR
ncbi:hypothetical protein Q1695_015607 [Nippostrongylus brasiliensis]|nr:hypothetical protein Q1695_015607 [Nippostrongylus brasiliensis]